MAATNEVTQTYNQDVVGLTERIDDFTYEMMKSQSSNVHDVSEFDQERLLAYINAVNVYMDWIEGQPQLDLPETSPKLYPLPAPPELLDIENSAVKDVVRLWTTMRGELVSSQSARRATGLLSFDSKRIRAVVNKLSAFLTDYISKVQPIDMPESSPEAPVTGPGRIGV
jgi:hypothetical protein